MKTQSFSTISQIIGRLLILSRIYRMDEEVQTVRYFNGLATLGVNYFDQVYKKPDQANIPEIIKVSRFFP